MTDRLSFPFDKHRTIKNIFRRLFDAGARDILLVGGVVRDFLLGRRFDEFDIEVYGLDFDKIVAALAGICRTERVGKSFGVLKVGHNIDIALPRTEVKAGIGHTGFDVHSDPNLDPKVAFSRRDFTINAMGIRLDGTLVDFYGGEEDLKKKILRAPSPAFKEDPLRVLRAMQFASRFEMTLDERTAEYCREVVGEFSTLSKERLYEEWKKWALKGRFPSMGLDILKQTGWVKLFPELDALIGCQQNPQWHPEGDAWTHTSLVTNEMAKHIAASRHDTSRGEPYDDQARMVLMFAALCHDLGKPVVSCRDETGTIRSHGHAEAGVPLAVSFLESIKVPSAIIDRVLPLVREHMAILNTQKLGAVTPRTLRRLANRLWPATVRQWCAVCQSDALGCFPPARDDKTIRFQADVWLDAAEREAVRDAKPKPILQGRDLLSRGMSPGPAMGRVLDDAYEAQLNNEINTIDEANRWLDERLFMEE